MIKFTILLRRHPSLSHPEFVTYHQKIHAPLFCSLPEVQQHVRKYIQNHTLPLTLPGIPPIQFDGITELWFDDIAGLKSVFEAERYLQLIRPDEEKFLDLHGCEFILSQEHPVIA